MSEQEAAAFGERLCRVWDIASEELKWEQDPGRAWNLGEGHIFEGKIDEDVPFLCWSGENLFRILSRQFDIVLSCSEGTFSAWRYPLNERDTSPSTPFTAQWLPYFRRCCWLSGCPIEATAHEKAEWIQGFSREEVEEWNLKF